MERKVVITGIGAVSPFGIGIDVFWKGLMEGQSKIKLLNIDLDKTIYTPYGAQCEDFDFNQCFEYAKHYNSYTDRAMQFILVATHEACTQAKLFEQYKNLNKDRVGVYLGTTTAGHVSAYNQAQRLYHNECFTVENIYQCTPGAWPLIVGNYLKVNGPMKSFCISCSAGGESIGNAFRDIKDGNADIIVTGGGDAPISKINYLSFYLIKTTSRWKGNPSEACQPYSKNRPGMVFGEGGGVLVLEEKEHALRRGVQILGEIVNYSANTDGFHIVAPEPHAVRYGKVITDLLDEVNVAPEKVGYISCHGTGTERNDSAETLAIKKAFGEHAYKLRLSSIKSMIGHAFGGATALEIISLVKALIHGEAPPTMNYKNRDENCDLDCIPNKSCKINAEYGLKIATGFGGSNNALLLKKHS